MREFQKRNRKKRHFHTRTRSCEYMYIWVVMGRGEKEKSMNECDKIISALHWVICDERYIMPRMKCATNWIYKDWRWRRRQKMIWNAICDEPSCHINSCLASRWIQIYWEPKNIWWNSQAHDYQNMLTPSTKWLFLLLILLVKKIPNQMHMSSKWIQVKPQPKSWNSSH